MKCQCQILLQIAAFSYQADSKRKMCSGKHDEFCAWQCGGDKFSFPLFSGRVAVIVQLCQDVVSLLALPMKLCQGTQCCRLARHSALP